MKTFFICGPHCSGKSSIISQLKSEGIIQIAGSEIGKDFYYERRKSGFDTATAGKNFEYEVTNAEIDRDSKIVKSGGINVVESWHPGNLAYILERTPEVYDEILTHLKANSPFFQNIQIRGIQLKVSKENIFKRTKTFADKRVWAANFYTKISRHIDTAIKDFGLRERTIIIDANGSYPDIYNQVMNIIAEI